MISGAGYWLDPRNGALYRVSTHNDWLLDPSNQELAGLSDRSRAVLAKLDPVREIDEIRMIGVLAGLIRIRDRIRRLSIQFYANPDEVPGILKAVISALPQVTTTRYPFLAIQNLKDDSMAALHLQELKQRLESGQQVLDYQGRLPENVALRRRMEHLQSEDH